MSFVVTAPELVEAAAQDLAGIHSELGEVTTAAAGSTTGIAAAAADEVSAAVATLFGDYGQEFHALSAHASAFHQEFVNLLKAGGNAYLGTEITNAEQTLKAGVSSSFASAQAPPLLQGLETFASTVAGPYETLLNNTATNLGSLGNAFLSNPAPLVQQIISNQLGYAERLATGFSYAITHLPAELANLPVAIQTALQNLANFNPAAFAQWVINNQIGYYTTISTALSSAAHDFTVGLQGLPASFQSAYQALLAGNVNGALNDIGDGFLHLFITGFDVTTGANAVLTITPTGTLGDLLPILSIPGQMAQNFTSLLPAGSIPGQMAQNFTNVLKTVTNTSITSMIDLFVDPTQPSGIGVIIDANMGLPLALGIDLLGSPVTTFEALGSSVASFTHAVETGNPVGALEAVLDAPAVVANGFLNGQATLPLTIDALGIPTTLNIPLDGILVPTGPYTATIPLLGGGPFPVIGTPLGGALPGFLNDLPEEIAEAIGKIA
jgi:PE family